ncbi:MAG: hypothetical protein WD065_09635 [Planctomycetaceae bacterium]
MTASLLFQVFLEGRKEPTRLGERHPAGQIADHKAREDNGLLHFAQDHLARAERRNIYHGASFARNPKFLQTKPEETCHAKARRRKGKSSTCRGNSFGFLCAFA